MAEAKKTATKKTTSRRSTSADAKTSDVIEAPKKAPAKPAADAVVWYESREAEPTQFAVAGYHPIRNFSNGRLEFRVKADDVERFEKNHFVVNSRIVRKR